eukprot:3896211-Rhodomonas_salina.2
MSVLCITLLTSSDYNHSHSHPYDVTVLSCVMTALSCNTTLAMAACIADTARMAHTSSAKCLMSSTVATRQNCETRQIAVKRMNLKHSLVSRESSLSPGHVFHFNTHLPKETCCQCLWAEQRFEPGAIHGTTTVDEEAQQR